jgi:hypothetical protein
MSFYLGCAVWGYKAWVGDLFPPRSKQADFLRLYSRRLSTVEGNTTFYETNVFYFPLLLRCPIELLSVSLKLSLALRQGASHL